MANPSKANTQPETAPGYPEGVLSVETVPVVTTPASKGSYEIRIFEHPSLPKNDTPEVPYLAFTGPFSECWSFIEALDSVKPGQSVGSLTMERITAPYLITLARNDGNGASFKITNKGGNRKSEVVLK